MPIHRRFTDTGHDSARRQRKFHVAQHLTRGHAHRHRRFTDGRVDTKNSCERIAQNRKQRVDHQRDHSGAWSDASDEWDRDQESKKRKARHGLQHIGDTEHRTRPGGAARKQDSNWDADGGGDGHRHQNEHYMLRSQTENVIDESRPHIPLSRTTERGGSVFPQILGSVSAKSWGPRHALCAPSPLSRTTEREGNVFPPNREDAATHCALVVNHLANNPGTLGLPWSAPGEIPSRAAALRAYPRGERRCNRLVR